MSNEIKLFKQLRSILSLDLGDSIEDYMPLVWAHLQTQGYRYKQEVSEAYQWCVNEHFGDVEEAFSYMVNSELSFNQFAQIAEAFIERDPERAKIDREGEIMMEAMGSLQTALSAEQAFDNLLNSVRGIQRASDESISIRGLRQSNDEAVSTIPNLKTGKAA